MMYFCSSYFMISKLKLQNKGEIYRIEEVSNVKPKLSNDIVCHYKKKGRL